LFFLVVAAAESKTGRQEPTEKRDRSPQSCADSCNATGCATTSGSTGHIKSLKGGMEMGGCSGERGPERGLRRGGVAPGGEGDSSDDVWTAAMAATSRETVQRPRQRGRGNV
jgi:hypothetical protein